MHPELKYAFDQVCNLFDVLDDKLCIMEKAKAEGKLSNILRFELMSFMMCLSESDGRISKVEAQLIRDYFGLNIYPGHIKELIEEHKIGSMDYFHRVPETIKLAVQIDNAIVNQNKDFSKGLSEIVVELFKLFGKEMIVSDEKVKLEEQKVWSEYITMLVQYLERESLIYNDMPGTISRPGSPIEVKYENSLETIGRIYTIYYGHI